MSSTPVSVKVDSCPLCGADAFFEDSVPEPNLYSEMLAELLDRDEQQILDEHVNCRCAECGLIFKGRWFPDSVIQDLFERRVPTHPRGWDAALERFSAVGFRTSLTRWDHAVKNSAISQIRRGQRELISILESIVRPAGFDLSVAVEAVSDNNVDAVHGMSEAIVASIDEPVPFKRFSGFRSRALWSYLQRTTGGFANYAELGCPLWGMLPLAAQQGVRATYLHREEPNYWGRGCVNAGEHCSTLLQRDKRISTARWDETDRYDLVGLFQYLDHLADPRAFLGQVFAKSNAAAVILDGAEAPVAVQHITGWNESSFRYVADLFGKSLHVDFDDIRPSGNILYLLTESL